MADFDKQWFRDRIEDRGLTASKLAAMMGLHRSLMSKRLSGHIPISMAEAADMSKFLAVEIQDLIRRAGVDLPEGRKARLVGRTAGLGLVRPLGKGGPKEIDVPGAALARLQGIVIENDGALEGWVVLFAQAVRPQAEAVGRLAVVVAGGKTWLGILVRDAIKGRWNVLDMAGSVLAAGLAIESASPVLWVRT